MYVEGVWGMDHMQGLKDLSSLCHFPTLRILFHQHFVDQDFFCEACSIPGVLTYRKCTIFFYPFKLVQCITQSSYVFTTPLIGPHPAGQPHVADNMSQEDVYFVIVVGGVLFHFG